MIAVSYFFSDLANAYSSLVSGCRKTGKLDGTFVKPALVIWLSVAPTTTQSLSFGVMLSSMSLIAPPTR